MIDILPTGYIFGWIDNGIVAVGMAAVAYLAIRCLPSEQQILAWKVTFAAILTATLLNTASDFAGCVGDPTQWDDIYGITSGCLTWSAMTLVPITMLARVRAA
tara:strand:- start:105 stop:413 length:309 start_codon:yes stop_codon:yes gene_type:complete